MVFGIFPRWFMGLRDIGWLLDELKARAPRFWPEEVSDVTCCDWTGEV